MSDLHLDDADYVAIAQHALKLMRRKQTPELLRSVIHDIDVIVEVCAQTCVNEDCFDTPLVVWVPNTVRRQSVIAFWWFVKHHGFDARIDDKLGPNGEAQLVFGFFLDKEPDVDDIVIVVDT